MGLVNLSEYPDGLQSDVNGTPVVHVEEPTSSLLWDSLSLSRLEASRIVVNNIDPTEGIEGFLERCLDIGGTGHIQRDHEKLRSWIFVGEGFKGIGITKSGDNNIAIFEYELGERTTESSRRTSNCRLL